jgi:predicted nucleic acid-binding protein
MSVYLDSSVLVAALIEDEPAHEPCIKLLRGKGLTAWTHALAEIFAALTGGRLGIRVSPAIAVRLIQESIVPRLSMIELSGAELTQALIAANEVGARGGAIYDLLHLKAARKAAAGSLYTLNTRHFAAVARKGDPKIEFPG